MSTRVGTICYATQSGLGILAKRFYDHRIIHKILIIDHPHYENHPEWYLPEDRYSAATASRFAAEVDTAFIFENAWHYWPLIKSMKAMGKRFVFMPMYEYSPTPLPVAADLTLCPSALDMEFYRGPNVVQVTVPVDKPWRMREYAHHFVHNAGHGGKEYRNGTPELLDAMQYVKAPIKLTVRMQPNEKRMVELYKAYKGRDPRVELVMDNVPEEQLYDAGDVFIFPEKFNGLSLPMQEAYASGMIVMGTNRFPMNQWLPNGPLIPPFAYRNLTIAQTIKCCEHDPRRIAEWIDLWYGKGISNYSALGHAWGVENSWQNWIPRYKNLLEN